MTNTLAIDPGSEKSAWVVVDDLLTPVRWAWEDNRDLLDRFGGSFWFFEGKYVELVIEDISHMGMAVGKDVFETLKWIGRFDFREQAKLITRKEVKLHICGSVRAKDSNVRQAVIDRYGGDRVAIGGKRCAECGGKGWRGRGRPQCLACAGTGKETPEGVLCDFSRAGMGSHGWSALALALTAVGP